MKVCVFSDSHGCPENLVRAVEAEKPALCFFLGDGERDLGALRERFPDLPVYAVRGNCDLRSGLPKQLACAVGGVRIFATHGHLYDVKHDPSLFGLLRAAEGADLALFGHTHTALAERREGTVIFNPGSIGRSARPSYGVITIGEGETRTEIRRLG